MSAVSTITNEATPAGSQASASHRWLRLLLWAFILISVIMIIRALPFAQIIYLVQDKIEALGPWGPIVFGVLYIIAGLLFVPGAALTLAAGALFGLGLGTVTVSITSTITAALAFLIARYLARSRVQDMAARNRTFGAIDKAIEQGGWKIVALLRLSPAVPFSLGNYLYGLTPVRFWPYVLASWIAMLPGTFLYVYLGYAGRAAVGAGGSAGERNPWEWVFLGAGLIATIVVTVYVTRLAKKALRDTPVKHSAEQSSTVSADANARSSKPLWPLIVAALSVIALAACAHLSKDTLNGLFGPPAVTLQEQYESKPDGPVFDHSQFDQLLHKFVVDGGCVDYLGLQNHSSQLDSYIQSIGSAKFDGLGRDERLALLINAYNAFTLRLILDHYPIESIKDIASAERWDARRWNIAGNTYSLNQIEHELIRPNFAEPRIHFALVCAAIGCPPLRNEAYTGARLEQQLTDQAKYVHSHDRWFRIHPERNEIELTALYDWYGSDFKQQAASVVAYAARFSPELVRMINAGQTPSVKFLGYDWRLNSIANCPVTGEDS